LEVQTEKDNITEELEGLVSEEAGNDNDGDGGDAEGGYQSDESNFGDVGIGNGANDNSDDEDELVLDCTDDEAEIEELEH